MGVRVEIHVPQKYPAYCIALLEQLFANTAVATVSKHFTDGQSGTFVFLVEPTRQDGEKELPVVVKIGPRHLLEQEWRAAQDHIASRLPDFVPISGQLATVTVTAADGSRADYSAARYQLAGNGLFATETLRDYATTASAAALWTVLEKRLFAQLDRIWANKKAPVSRSLGAAYDRVLPVNLLLEFAEAAAPAAVQLDATQDPATYPQLQPGDWVQLNNFVISEIDEVEQALTLNLPQSEALRTHAYRLRIRQVANLKQYKLDATVSRLTGRVVATRQQRLQAALRSVLPATLDLTRPVVLMPDSGVELPNPLAQWPSLLQEQLSMRSGTVHGDLNTGNVLIDVEAKTTFLIDCAHAHEDHVLLDLVRLESEVLLHLVAARFFELQLPPTTIHALYGWLDYVTQRASNPAGSFSVPQPLLQAGPALESAFIALTIIRNHARQYLAVRDQWREYYAALALTLLGSLKFASLDRAPAGTNPKAVAFWGAATLLGQLDASIDFIHLGWQRIDVNEGAASQPQTPGGAPPNLYIDYGDVTHDQRRGVFFEGNASVAIGGNVISGGTVNTTNFQGPVTGPIHTGSGDIHVGGPASDVPASPPASNEFATQSPAQAKREPATARPNDVPPAPPQPDRAAGMGAAGGGTTRRVASPSSAPRKIKILFLTANPFGTDRLRTDEEARAIDQALRQAEFRNFDIVVHQAVRIDDLQELLLRHRPDIVHFSGHGSAANELILQDANGNAVPVSGKALHALFTSLKDQIRCVVLNACYTDEQARSLAEVIDCVVGINPDLTDEASIQFATAFYRALGYGLSVQEAFHLGQVQIELAGAGEGAALHLHGAVAAQTRFADPPPFAAHAPNPGAAIPPTSGTAESAAAEPHNRTDIHNAEGSFISTGSGNINVDQSRHVSLHLFTFSSDAVKSWANDFFRLEEADEHARSGWEGRTLYLLGATMKRVSDEGLLAFLLTALTAALAIWFIAPILAWPQPDDQARLFAAIRFGVASFVLPLLIAVLIKPEGTEKFPMHENATQRKLLALKLAGAWTGFGALAGTALTVVIVWYHLLGFPLLPAARWILALLPIFFAYVSARRIPLDRYKMFKGELRLHDADPLFLTVFALFGPALAALVYWGHWFLINQAVMLSALLGIIGLTVWEIHRRDKRRFPDLLVIPILGVLLPLGFLLLFFFDMRPFGAPLTFISGEVGIFALFAVYLLGTTLLLATVGVRQPTVITLRGTLSLLALLLVMLGVSVVNLWLGRAVLVGMLLLWYGWGRRQWRDWTWLWVHPSVDWLIATLIGAAVLGRYTTLPLWANATLFGVIAVVLVRWAYRQAPIAVEASAAEATASTPLNGKAKAKPMTNSVVLQTIIVFFVIIATVAVLWIGGYLTGLQPTPVQHFVIGEWSLQPSSASNETTQPTPPVANMLTAGTRTALYEKLAVVDELKGLGFLDTTVVKRGTGQSDYWIEGVSRQNADTARVELIASIERDNGEFIDTVSITGEIDQTDSAHEACILILQQQLALAILEKLAIEPSAETVAKMQRTPTTDCRALELNNQAADLLDNGQPDSAIFRLEVALRIDPGYADAYNNLGRAFYQRGEFATAIEFSQKALAQQTHNPIFHYNLGLAYERSERYAEAVAAYQAALAIEPLYIEALNNLGFTLLLMDNLVEAQIMLEKGLALTDTVPALHKNLGRIRLEQAQPQAAIVALEQAIAQHGEAPYPEALFYLAVAQQEIGDGAAACRTLYQYAQNVAKDIPERASKAEAFFIEWTCEDLVLE